MLPSWAVSGSLMAMGRHCFLYSAERMYDLEDVEETRKDTQLVCIHCIGCTGLGDPVTWGLVA